MSLLVHRWLSASQILVFLIYCVQLCSCQTQKASYFCKSVPNNANQANILFGVVPKSDSIYRIYAFDATQADTLSTSNRITDCFQDNTVTNPNEDRISFDITIDFTAASGHTCGAYVTGSTVKTITYVFRTQAYDGLITGDDVVYRIRCFSDNLSDQEIATPGYSGSEAVEVDLFEPNRGISIRVRQESTNFPLTVVPLGESVYISLEFAGGLVEGQDNRGIEFCIGFLGNDIINSSLVSSELLFLVVIPRYQVSTYVTVTTVHGSTSRMSENQEILVFELKSDLMGCSDDGEAEIVDKGVEITSTHEVTVLVCNHETDTEDCYAAFPTNILDTDYFAVSVSATNEVSELLIAAPEDNIKVDLTLPSYTGLTVSLDEISVEAGETLSFTLNKREVFHLSVSSSSSPESVAGFKIHADKPVSVISGNRAHLNDHLVAQIPGVTKLGLNYVLPPADPVSDGRLTTYIIQATSDGDTVVKRYLTSSTFDTHTISLTTSPLIIDVSDPCELTADKPILIAQVVNGPTGSGGYESAMLILPSVQQWSPNYSFYIQDGTAKVTIVFPNEDAAKNFKLGSSSASLTGLTDVAGPNGYKFYSSVPLSSGSLLTFSSTDDITNFMPLVYVTNSNKDIGLAYLPSGYRFPTTGECPTTVAGKQGDLLDNDCDGLIDEELVNLIDDDLDGKIDEDPTNAAAEFVDVVGIRPINCLASGIADFSDLQKRQAMTDSTGCVVPLNSPFTPSSGFTQRITAGGRKIYNCGAFKMAMFEDEDNVYIKCDLKFCLSESDTSCTTEICDSPGRRKREEDSTNVTRVVTSVQVVPRITGTETNTGSEGKMDPITCLENTYILAIFIVLIILVIISFGTALCFCCLFRQRRNESKLRSEYGHHRKSI